MEDYNWLQPWAGMPKALVTFSTVILAALLSTRSLCVDSLDDFIRASSLKFRHSATLIWCAAKEGSLVSQKVGAREHSVLCCPEFFFCMRFLFCARLFGRRHDDVRFRR